jgi:DNA polymerase-3 subunit epsilon
MPGSMDRIAVIDFETTGISPSMGDRATEVAIVLLERGQVVDRFQSLMNAGVSIPAFITQLTGITNAMVAAAPRADRVMAEAARFVGNAPMVAHNASFDRRYWQAELELAGQAAPQPFACTVLLSRRLYPDAPSHKLGALVQRLRLPQTGAAHRAMADAEMAAALLTHMQHDLRTRHGVAEPDHRFLMGMQACSRSALPRWLAQQGAGAALSAAVP